MDEKTALNQAFKLCSKKEYASGEMYQKFLDWGFPEEKASEMIQVLISERFLDDQRYTQAFSHDKLKFSKWGKVKITYMLRQKGIEKQFITEALTHIDPETYSNILEGELLKKIKALQSADDYEVKGKLIRFALTKGFEYDIAEKVAEKLIKSRNL